MVLRKVIKEKHSPCSAVPERDVVILRCALRAASTFLWSKLALLKMTSSKMQGVSSHMKYSFCMCSKESTFLVLTFSLWKIHYKIQVCSGDEGPHPGPELTEMAFWRADHPR